MSSSRHFINNLDPNSGFLTTEEFTLKLWATVDAVLAYIDAQVVTGSGLIGPGVYLGLSGIGLMYFHLANQAAKGVEPPTTEIREAAKSEAVKLWNQKYLLEKALDFVTSAEALSIHLKDRYTFHEGVSGIYALKACILSHLHRSNEARDCIMVLEDIHKSVSQMKPGECEILYGRCGYLLSLLFTQTHVGMSSVRKDIVANIAKQVCSQNITFRAKVLEEGKRFARVNRMKHLGLLYTWHGQCYLGGCHGLAGILLLLFLCKEELLTVCSESDTLAVLDLAAKSLLQMPCPSGNFPSSLGKKTDSLVQWCHGAPGFIPLLCYLGNHHNVMENTSQHKPPTVSYAHLAKQASECIWERGLLTKGMGLCHGISGNAYAFLTLYRYDKEEAHLNKARAFASFIMDSWEQLIDLPDRSASLYEGAAGAVCFLIDVINPHASKFPGFEL